MEALAIVLDEPRRIDVRQVVLREAGPADAVVAVHHTSVSAGTERLLWEGTMPAFPGMGYPLVPGYETVGRVEEAGPESPLQAGDPVFVPGAHSFVDVRALFGGAAAHLVVKSDKVHRIDHSGEEAALLALAATAHHAIAVGGAPELVVGHGVLGQLLARITIALGEPAPVVHELNAARMTGEGYDVLHPDADEKRDYRTVMDASGHHGIIDVAVKRLARSGTVTLAGFYGAEMSFAFPAAFMKEARIAIAAEWDGADLIAVRRLLDAGSLSLSNLVTHRAAVADAQSAYATAFTDPDCLKMVLNWRKDQ
jgi:3-hydroxyethyl bacteriochlorophyllide a dehydrogenase